MEEDSRESPRSNLEGVTVDHARSGEPTSTLVDVKMVVAPAGFVFAQQLHSDMEVKDALEGLKRVSRCDGAVLSVIREEMVFAPDASHTDEHILIHVSMDPIPAHLQSLTTNELLLTVAEVRASAGADDLPKTVLVPVVKGYDRKPFLGGHRVVRTALEYHDATAQTDRPLDSTTKPKVKQESCSSRTTQTPGRSSAAQTKREVATQMARPGLELDTSKDRWVVSKAYVSADQLHAIQTIKCLVLQAATRAWLARRRVKLLREERQRADMELAAAAAEARAREAANIRRQQDRRRCPKTAADFNVLYDELEAWRLNETIRIQQTDMPQPDKHVAHQELLKQETRVLQTIDALRVQAAADRKEALAVKELTAMASPKTLRLPGELGVTTVETPYTVRSRELIDLLNGLQATAVGLDERLDLLLRVKWTVKEFECSLTREIMELIDREADLLNRGRKASTLDGLRQRLVHLFRQFCETPEFNPEAIHHQRVPLEFTTRPRVTLDSTRRSGTLLGRSTTRDTSKSLSGL